MKLIKYDSVPTNYPVYTNMVSLYSNVSKVVEIIRDIMSKNDVTIGLVCTGTSGICIATALAQHCMDWRIIHIRKAGYESHSYDNLHLDKRDNKRINNWHLIFVDDLISSGDTLIHCMTELKHDKEFIGHSIQTIALVSRCSDVTNKVREFCEKSNIKLPETMITRY